MAEEEVGAAFVDAAAIYMRALCLASRDVRVVAAIDVISLILVLL